MTTTLNCLQWMQSQGDQTPCVTAQAVGQLCNPEYTVSLTSFQESDYIPNTATANNCTCSWSNYNLLNACSYCVGQYQYISWSVWITNCGSFVSNTSYLPSGLSLPQGIPFWAVTNPTHWKNGTFNVPQAADIAEEAQPDVTGGPLPTSTTMVSSPSSPSVGIIVGGVIGGIVIIVIGGLVILWAIRRHLSRRTHITATEIRSLDHSQLVIEPSTRARAPAQPTLWGNVHALPAHVSSYSTSPPHPTTGLAPTSLHQPNSSSFLSRGQGTAMPLVDAADMITPFLAMSSSNWTNRSEAPWSSPRGKATQVFPEHVMAPPGQRARLYPPPYSAATEPALSAEVTTLGRRVSITKQKRHEGTISRATTCSGRLSTSTEEGVQAGPQVEQSCPCVVAPDIYPGDQAVSVVSSGSVGSVDDSDSVETAH